VSYFEHRTEIATSLQWRINDASEIVDSYGQIHAIDGSIKRRLPNPDGGRFAGADAINSDSVVAGTASYLREKGLARRAVTWTGEGAPQVLACPGETDCNQLVGGINSKGIVVGSVTTVGTALPCYWEDGKVVLLTTAASGPLSSASGINESGVIVGNLWNSGSGRPVSVPFIWRKAEGLRHLQDMFDAGSNQWMLTSVAAINGKNWILGSASKGADRNRNVPVLLVPETN
jgi:uncharacterized membrane protein